MPREGCAVLVVDDDRINRALLSRMLEHEGYRPRTAVNGREALTALGAERFDAVLLDLVMPEVDGLEVLRTVKADARLWHIPVIMISGVEDTESIVACLELGADDYVQKPFDPVLLRARLNACLARRQFHDLEVAYQKMVQEQADELEDLRQRDGGAGGATGETATDHGDPRARWASVAVLAVGLAGLNDFAAGAGPTSAVAVVDAFQATVGGLAERFDGAVVARGTDILTVVFGGARPSPDPAAAGLGMAIAVDGEIAALVPDWGNGHELGPTWGAGLAVGDATVGMLGTGEVSRVAVVGPVVDRAARLRDLGRGGAVLLDEAAFAATERVGTDGLAAELWEGGGPTTPPTYRLRSRRTRTGRDAPAGPGPVDAG